MISIKKNTLASIVPRIFLFGILFELILVFLSRVLVPTTSLLSIAGACFILVIYGVGGFFVFPRIPPEILTPTVVFGLLAGSIFASEILLEYALLPKDITSWGLVEFGMVFALYFLSGVWVVYQDNSIKHGTLAAITTAMLSSVVWLLFALLTFYLFRRTVRQELVFTAEGNFEDFARSGMNDFNTFVMEDLLGASFFHLLLSPIVASLLGTIGGLFGRGIAQLRN